MCLKGWLSTAIKKEEEELVEGSEKIQVKAHSLPGLCTELIRKRKHLTHTDRLPYVQCEVAHSFSIQVGRYVAMPCWAVGFKNSLGGTWASHDVASPPKERVKKGYIS